MWAACMASAYLVMVCSMLCVFGLIGWLDLHWHALPLLLPLLALGALAFASVGLLFTALLPSMDHMGLPFFLVIMPLGFGSSTYFPLPDSAWVRAVADPSADLMTPMKGPFRSERGGEAALARAAITLCKQARLLPSALVEPAV